MQGVGRKLGWGNPEEVSLQGWGYSRTKKLLTQGAPDTLPKRRPSSLILHGAPSPQNLLLIGPEKQTRQVPLCPLPSPDVI